MFILKDKELIWLVNRTPQYHEMTLTHCSGDLHYGIIAKNQWTHMLGHSPLRPGQQAGRADLVGAAGRASPRPYGFRIEPQYHQGAKLSKP